MIRGYPAKTTVAPGDDLLLHVSTDAPRFRVDFHRFGAPSVLVWRSEWHEGCLRPDHLPFSDWGRTGTGLHGEELPAWPAYAFRIGESWRPGVYFAVLVEEGEPGGTPPLDAREGRALFVVRAGTAGGGILYKLPLLTYHAYNCVAPCGYDRVAQRGTWSLYTIPAARDLPAPVPPAVSLLRPGGGTGGWPSDAWNFDPFDPTPRQTFGHWDARFITWLERNGYAVDYCTDLDVHADAGLLTRYRLLLSSGHDEYWTDEMRANVARAVAAGRNVAFFGGNTCWWRVTFDDHCSFRRALQWSDPAGATEPENTLTGVSFRNGGERDLDEHPDPVGYRVQHADHWVFEGTGLADGDTFGDGPGEYLVGYECDGALFDRSLLGRGRTVRPAGDDGTPESFVILGIGDAAASGWGFGNRAATMGVHEAGGQVFTAATTDWPRLLGPRPHPVVERVTHNVVERLSSP